MLYVRSAASAWEWYEVRCGGRFCLLIIGLQTSQPIAGGRVNRSIVPIGEFPEYVNIEIGQQQFTDNRRGKHASYYQTNDRLYVGKA
jgi:hypothetical protein